MLAITKKVRITMDPTMKPCDHASGMTPSSPSTGVAHRFWGVMDALTVFEESDSRVRGQRSFRATFEHADRVIV